MYVSRLLNSQNYVSNYRKRLMRRELQYFEVKVCSGSTLWFVTKTRNEDVAEETKPCERNGKYRNGAPHHGPTLHQRGV